MKRFVFQLEPVLNFKQQSLDALMVELAAVQARMAAQEMKCDIAYQRLADYDAQCAERKTIGITVVEAMEQEVCQRVLEQRARREKEELNRLQKEVERQREKVVEARQETHSLERLKEIRQQEYNTAIQKAEEKTLDDLTAARRAAAVAG